MSPAPPVILPFSLAVAALTLAGQQTVLAEAKIGVAAVVKGDTLHGGVDGLTPISVRVV
mgnify:CR=1 FL=1